MSQPEWDRAQWRPRREPLHLSAEPGGPTVGPSWASRIADLVIILAAFAVGIAVGRIL